MKSYTIFSLILVILFLVSTFIFDIFLTKHYVLFLSVIGIVWLFVFLYNLSLKSKESKKQVAYSLAAIGAKFNLLLIFVIIYQFTYKLEVLDAVLLLGLYSLLMFSFYFIIVRRDKSNKSIS
jgi:hypothetical protein